MGITRKGIKIALGKKKQHPFWSLKPATGEVIHDQTQNMQRLAVHYSTLYDRESSFTFLHTLDAIKPLPMLEKPDSQTTLESSTQPWTPSSVAKHLDRINRISASL